MTAITRLWQKQTVGLSVFYFVWLGAGSFVIPFLDLYLSRLGLTGVQIGFVRTAGAVVTLLAAPFWGTISAHVERPRRLLQWILFASSMSAGFTISVGIVVPVQAGAILATMMLWFFIAGSYPITEAIAVQTVRRSRFGSVRLWGSLGWAILGFCAGFVIQLTNIRMTFVLYALLTLSSIWILQGLTTKPPPEDAAKTRATTWQGIQLIRQNPVLMVLVVVLIVAGFAFETVQGYEPLYLDSLNAQEGWLGVMLLIGALTEVVMMKWADHAIERYGAATVLMLAYLAELLRAVIVLMFPIVWVIVFSYALRGTRYALQAISVVHIVSGQVEARYQAMGLAIFGITLFRFNTITASPLAGWVFDTYGGYWLYSISLVGQIIAVPLIWFVLRPSVRRQSEITTIHSTN